LHPYKNGIKILDYSQMKRTPTAGFFSFSADAEELGAYYICARVSKPKQHVVLFWRSDTPQSKENEANENERAF